MMLLLQLHNFATEVAETATDNSELMGDYVPIKVLFIKSTGHRWVGRGSQLASPYQDQWISGWLNGRTT